MESDGTAATIVDIIVSILWVMLCGLLFMLLIPMVQSGAPWPTWRPGYAQCVSLAATIGIVKLAGK